VSGSHLFWYSSDRGLPGVVPSGINSTAKTSPACAVVAANVFFRRFNPRVLAGISLNSRRLYIPSR